MGPAGPSSSAPVAAPTTPLPQSTAVVPAVAVEEPPRDLVHMFWGKLTVSQRADVVAELGLLESHEQALPEHRRYDPIWRRAKERNLIPQLAVAIKQVGRA